MASTGSSAPLERERVRRVLERSGEAATALDPDGNSYTASHNYLALVGLSSIEELHGRSTETAIHPQDRAAADEVLRAAEFDPGRDPIPIRVRHASGRWIASAWRTSHDVESGKVIALSSVRACRDQLAHFRAKTRYDFLTGVANRAALLESLVRPSGEPSEHSVAVVHIDGLKAINDTFGLPTGDEALQRVADRLITSAPEARLIARIRGDRFAVLFDSTFSAHDALDRLVAVGSHPLDLLAASASVAVTVGLTTPDRGGDGADRLRHAELAIDRSTRD